MFKSNRDYKLYLEDISAECKNIPKEITEKFDEFENIVNTILQNI